MPNSAIQLDAFFLKGAAGNLFSVYFSPVGEKRATVIFLPPFVEEANRCRAIVSQQARVFAANGYGTLLIDPYGTGDSEGELENANWDIWLNDTLTAVNWINVHGGGRIILWGVRLGALLAIDIANKHPGMFDRLLLWQPVIDGKIYLTQFLRQRIVSLSERNEPTETTTAMLSQLEAGAVIEIAGYTLAGKMASDIKFASIKKIEKLDDVGVLWIETIATTENSIPMANQVAIEHLRSIGVNIQTSVVVSPPFWTLQKRAEAPDLIKLTIDQINA